MDEIESSSIGVVLRHPLIRRSRSFTLPQFEISVFDMDNITKMSQKVSLSLQNLPIATFSPLPKGEEQEKEENLFAHSPSPTVSSSNFFLDECPALLSQVPDSFDLGRTRVRLNSIATSARHIAIGSECGALFLFNRRIGQSVKPLRTDNSEVISAMEFCYNEKEGSELLAVGHRSGKIVILSLPCADVPNPKLLQHVQDEAHRHSAVRCLCWNFDGRMLFSGDELGMVLVTHVDFTNEQFPIGVVENAGVVSGGPIVAMFSLGPYFAFAKGRKCKVCNWQRDNETIAEVTTTKEIVSIHLLSNAFDQLSLLQSDGKICGKKLFEKGEELFELGSFSYDAFDGQEMRVLSFSDCNGPSWAIWTQNGHIQTCRFRIEGFAMEEVVLEGRIDQVLSVCASSPAASSFPSSDELFLLCAPSVHPLQQRRRIFRLSRLSPAHNSLTNCSTSSTNGQSLLFDYLYGTVEKAVGEFGRLKNAAAGSDDKETGKILPQGTEQLLSRLNRELDVFLMGNGPKGVEEADGTKSKSVKTLADFLPEFGTVFPEGTTKIATGLHHMFGQLRQQSSNLFSMPTEDDSLQNELGQSKSAESDHLSLENALISRENSFQGRETYIEGENDSEFGHHFVDQLDDEKLEERKEGGKVRVERKRIVVRRKKMRNERPTNRNEKQNDERRQTPVEQHQKVEDNGKLTDWEQKKMTIEEDGEWTPGAVTDEKQQQILKVLGIVPTTSEGGDGSEVSQNHKMEITKKCDNRKANEEEDGPNGEELEKHINEVTWKLEEEVDADNSQLTDLRINTDKGYSFPSTNDEHHILEDEFPPIVPSVSLADLIALFPSASLPHSSASPALPTPVHCFSSPSSPFPSATLSSSASSSSSVFPVHPSPLYQRLLRLSPVSQWRRFELPFTVSNFTLCRHYLIACSGNKRSTKGPAEEKQRPHYLMANLLEDEKAMDEWVPLRVGASAVAVNDEGTLLWRIYDGVAYSPCSPPDPICPSTTLSRTTAWMEMSNQFEGNIIQIALNSQNAWFLADTGRKRKDRTVWVQMFLPEMGIFHRAVDEDNRHFFTQLAVSDHAVWTLSGGLVIARVGLKLDLSPMGLDWADNDGQPCKFVSIALHEQTGFGLERSGSVWFVHGVAENTPFGHGPWFKVCSPPDSLSLGLFQHSPSSGEWRLHVGAPGTFIVVGSTLLHTNAPLVGTHFEHLVPDRLVLNDHFTLITATGFCGLSNECLFLCQPSSDELFSFSLRKRHFTSLPRYCSDSSAKVQCLSANSTCLFVLDKNGELYVRPVGLRTDGSEGRMCRQWVQVKMPNAGFSSQISGSCIRNTSPVKFISIAVSSSSIWAVSDDGSIWASRSFDLSCSAAEKEPSDGEPIEMPWAKVEGLIEGETMEQIRVSPSGNNVWVFSKSGFAWYRAEVTGLNWMGRQWTTTKAVQSIQISELAVGDCAVWALAKGTDQLHRFCPVGWQPIDIRLKALSVDALEGRLWALDNEFRIVRHEMDVVSHPSSVALSDHSELKDSENVVPTSPRVRKTKEFRQIFSPIGNTCTETVRWAFNFRKMFSFFR